MGLLPSEICEQTAMSDGIDGRHGGFIVLGLNLLPAKEASERRVLART